MRALVAFASRHGSTEEIAVAIATRLEQEGIATEVRSAETVTDVKGYAAVILGSAIYNGSWMSAAMSFARRHAPALVAVPVWIFSSGPLGPVRLEDLQQPLETPELRELLFPEDHAMFSGRMVLDDLSFSERLLMRSVKATEGDFREWSEIDAWSKAVAGALADRPI